MDLPSAINTILDRRLRSTSKAPLAVAFSGGGDSLALLLAAKDWAKAHGRQLLVLTVDHGLNPASAGWTELCHQTAERLRLPFRALRWEGGKPAAGLPAAARAARHALLADAAREAGARVILLGHTADDLTEAAAMRAEGSTVSDAAEWGPSPAWPEGRDVFLLRPMLNVRREAIRDWLRARGETWIDDPANEDMRFARARARARQSSPHSGEGDHAKHGGGESVHGLPSTAFGGPPPQLRWGGLQLFVTAPPRAIAAACLCAAGTAVPPRGERLERLVERLRSGGSFTATLAGARIESDGVRAVFMRDSGRGGLPPLAMEQRFPKAKVGYSAVWDGRIEITTDRPGLSVCALAGLTKSLPRAEQQALKAIPASARPTLPVVAVDGTLSCPILAVEPCVGVRALALTRFEAAMGGVDSEPGV